MPVEFGTAMVWALTFMPDFGYNSLCPLKQPGTTAQHPVGTANRIGIVISASKQRAPVDCNQNNRETKVNKEISMSANLKIKTRWLFTALAFCASAAV